jgi:hypothetical protein
VILRRSPALVALVALAVGATACGDDSDAQPDATTTSAVAATSSTSTSSTSTTEAATTTVITTAAPAPTAAPTVAPSVPVTPPATDPPPPRAPYDATIVGIDPSIAARMSYSWRAGCPVPLEDLRLLTLPHWNDGGQTARGELVVHADVADAMVEVFRQLYEQRFPIARMELVDVFQADDQASMRANNTSAFNCREIDGRPGTWSQHSYGRAVDVNPLVNPWVRGSQVDPPEGAPYADRSQRVPGGIYAGDAVVGAFESVGWKWGGYWSTSKDHQHFSANGK